MGRRPARPAPDHEWIPASRTSRDTTVPGHWRPPCPGDPDDYEWVRPHARARGYWRAKPGERSTGRPEPASLAPAPMAHLVPPASDPTEEITEPDGWMRSLERDGGDPAWLGSMDDSEAIDERQPRAPCDDSVTMPSVQYARGPLRIARDCVVAMAEWILSQFTR